MRQESFHPKLTFNFSYSVKSKFDGVIFCMQKNGFMTMMIFDVDNKFGNVELLGHSDKSGFVRFLQPKTDREGGNGFEKFYLYFR